MANEHFKAPRPEGFRAWTQDQHDRLAVCLADPDQWVGYWTSDDLGFPCFGGSYAKPVRPGMVQRLTDDPVICKVGFYASDSVKPWLTDSSRVWVVALSGKVGLKKLPTSTKAVGQSREIIGEVLKLPDSATLTPGGFHPKVVEFLAMSAANLHNLTREQAQEVLKVTLGQPVLDQPMLTQVSCKASVYLAQHHAGCNQVVLDLARKVTYEIFRWYEANQWNTNFSAWAGVFEN